VAGKLGFRKGSLANRMGLALVKRVSTQSAKFDSKGGFICTFCLGKACVKENYKLCDNVVIHGLHSNMISDILIAS